MGMKAMADRQDWVEQGKPRRARVRLPDTMPRPVVWKEVVEPFVLSPVWIPVVLAGAMTRNVWWGLSALGCFYLAYLWGWQQCRQFVESKGVVEVDPDAE